MSTATDGERARQLTRNSYQVARKKQHTQDRNKREIRIRTPLILIDKLWTIRTWRAFSSWGFNIQVNNVVPSDSPVMRHCRNGDINEIQQLFSAGLASPFDCDPGGAYLLHVGPQRPTVL